MTFQQLPVELESEQAGNISDPKIDNLKTGLIKAHKILSDSTTNHVNIVINTEIQTTGSRLFKDFRRYKVTEFIATIKEPIE